MLKCRRSKSIIKDSIVFSPGRIGGLELKNRLVRSATYENAANENGTVSEKLIEIHRTLAEDGVGLIITGLIGVLQDARSHHLMAGIYDDRFIPGLKKLPQAVKETDKDRCYRQCVCSGGSQSQGSGI